MALTVLHTEGQLFAISYSIKIVSSLTDRVGVAYFYQPVGLTCVT